MNNSITLKEAIDGVLKCQRKNGHPESYLIDLRRTYNRLLGHAERLGTEYLTDDLISQFLADSNHSRSGEYCYGRFLAHNRCIRFLESYLETGKVSIHKLHKPVKEVISDGLAEALKLYDQAEEASGLSKASLIKNRRPIRYLLEYMTSLGYQELSDIQPGDTIKAIEDMLEKHYEPTSLVTAISGMRRFYEMFPELQPFRLEIPSRMPRKRSIIEVYSEDEQDKIACQLSSPAISRRDAAICLLSFETGLRNVDICGLRLGADGYPMPDHVHCHMVRKTRAMDLYREGVPLAHIQQLLGHENISTTSGFYAFATLDVLAKAMETVSPDEGIKSWGDPDTLERLYRL